MALKKIAIQGGVVKDDTVYSSEGKWIDSDKIRFTMAEHKRSVVGKS